MVVVLAEEVDVFFAVAGFEARCLFEADGLALAAVFFVDAVFTALESGSVFKDTEADTASTAGLAAICLAASRQFGKNNSIR
ncbi:MAG: hypothetical protein OHK003_20510 [Anaerolineales bacterium]